MNDIEMNEQTNTPNDIAEAERELTPEEQAEQARERWLTTVAQTVRECGSKEQYLTLTQLQELTEMDKETLLDMLKGMEGREEFKDICVYRTKKERYYYTYPLLAHNYVRNLALAKEDDLAVIIADVVRYESKIYPRATKIDTFSRFPYHYTEIQVKVMFSKMEKLKEFEDLHMFVSEKGNTYIYSSLHLSDIRAKKLVEIQEDPSMWM